MRFQNVLKWNAGLLILGLCLFGLSLQNTAHAADLNIGIAVEPDSIDPHFHHFGGNLNLTPQIFEPLISTDSNGNLVPLLATAWKAIDDQTWELTIRSGVKFHDGSPLTASDVAFTFARAPAVPNSPGGYAPFLRGVASVETPDPSHVIVHTKGPVPLLPNYLSLIGIISEHAGKGATTQDYNSGKAAIGTGPYRFVSWAKGDSIVLARNTDYWGTPPAFDNIRFHYIANVAARTAALRSGSVDLIDEVSIQDVDSIKQAGGFSVRNVVSQNVIAFQIDTVKRHPPFITGPNGEPLDQNPLADTRVRLALAMAINKEALKERVMNNAVDVADQIMAPNQYGDDPKLKPIAYDPAAAKKLLADAGYPNGFRMTMYCQSDRFANGSSICQAVAQFFTRIGVNTQPMPIPHSVFIGHANNHEYSFYTMFLVVDTGEPSQTMLHFFMTENAAKTQGDLNRGQYSNPTLDGLVTGAAAEVDAAKREPMLQQADDVLNNDVAWIPLFRPFNIVAMKDTLDYAPRSDGYTFAADVHLATQAKR